MNYYEGNYYQKKNYQGKSSGGGSCLAFFIVGLTGAVIGGLIIAFVLTGGSFFLLFGEDGPERENGLSDYLSDPPPPAQHQHTEVVRAVEEISPAVVGIRNIAFRLVGGEQVRIEQGTGSGVIITPDGYVITNQHVIADAREIEVVFRDGRVKAAELIGEDVLTDLAVVKIARTGTFDYAAFSDSDNVRSGEAAIAVGNPLGLMFQHTVTVGVVSAVERQVHIPGSQYRYTFIQTDAAINEGNSGGPLVNLAGEIIGINSAKIRDIGVEGIGFAIPANTVRRVLEDLVENGRVLRPLIGVIVKDYAEHTGHSSDRGVYIDVVSDRGPAQLAGIRQGDVIAGIDGQTVNFTAQLFDRLLEYKPGDQVELTIMRNGREHGFSIALGRMSE